MTEIITVCKHFGQLLKLPNFPKGLSSFSSCWAFDSKKRVKAAVVVKGGVCGFERNLQSSGRVSCLLGLRYHLVTTFKVN